MILTHLILLQSQRHPQFEYARQARTHSTLASIRKNLLLQHFLDA